MQYSRGSEWNRWDVHIHTPGTLKNHHFEGKTLEEQWEKFYADIVSYIGDGTNPQHKIVAMGITDYLSINNYLKIKADGILDSLIPFIFPNVELRITPIAQEHPINIHCLFNPKIAHELDGRFFSKLKFSKGTTSFSATDTELVRLGKSIDPSLDDVAAKKIASEQFVIPYTQLKELFAQDADLRKNTLIAISNKTTDGASGIANPTTDNFDSQLYETRAELYRMSGFIFSANENDIKYFLGEKTDTPETVCKKYGKLFPCVNGSDAHKNSDIFEPTQKRYCWIKAVPSFEGMKEITFEPKSRVRIQELKPENKADYYVIDKVIIENSDFSLEPIPFNDKLTCIIGGKSTGKSLLLHNMAEAISPQQVSDKLKITQSSYYQLDDIRVIWRDGVVSKRDLTDVEKKIVYLPQTYLNKLSDASEEKTEIDDIIHEILLQNAEIEALYKKHTSAITALKVKIDKKIYDLLSVFQNINEIKATKLEKGDISSVEREISKLKKQKEKLIQENSLSEDDIAAYDNLLKMLSSEKASLLLLENDKIQIQSIENLIVETELIDNISDTYLDLIKNTQKEIISSAIEKWQKTQARIIEKIDKEIAALQKSISDNEKKVSILKPKIEGNEAISQLSKEIVLEEQKLNSLRALDAQIEKYQTSFDTILDEIAHFTLTFLYIHNEYVSAVNTRSDINSDDLEFISDSPFRTEVFIQQVSEFIDNRKLGQIFKRNAKGGVDFFANDFDETFVKETILKILDAKNGLLKKSIQFEDVLRCIASDWYNITYTIKLDGDEIKNMSPGKKALVLLKLLINLAESKCPILIDQPEDDLDNRSVFVELVGFIRSKKIQRQIIIVTHNANIVVGCDAEEIIVANQNGNNAPNLEKRFEYRTGAIEDIHPLYDEMGNVMEGVLYKTGIQQHICEILEGGKEAFTVRRNKYTINE